MPGFTEVDKRVHVSDLRRSHKLEIQKADCSSNILMLSRVYRKLFGSQRGHLVVKNHL